MINLSKRSWRKVYKYLSDTNFLKKICMQKEQGFLIKITALSQNETPLEEIEGRVSGGSINIDGASTVRRTCSLNLVALLKNNEDINGQQINSQYWGLNTKFKIQIGIPNTLNEYQEYSVIWFPMGTFLISSFNVSYSTTGLNISISGKDKICFLNGDLGGNFSSSVDFGTIDVIDKTGLTITKKLPVEQIIREMVHRYGNEPYSNIIIEDIDKYGLNLETYRGEIPMYFFLKKNIVQNITEESSEAGIDSLSPINYTFDRNYNVYYKKEDSLGELEKIYFALADIPEEYLYQQGLDINLDENIKEFYVDVLGEEVSFYIRKIQYGDTIGYKLTDLTYPGDLIAKAGETVTSVLDKIKKMLGDFEYFYDTDGAFVFRKQRAYKLDDTILDTSDKSNLSLIVDKDDYIDFMFDNLESITNISNNPNIQNVKNDFTVWGAKNSGTNNTTEPIHIRYAIDKKPLCYTTIRITPERAQILIDNYPQYFVDQTEAGKNKLIAEHPGIRYVAKGTESSEEFYDADQIVDWRELIYQMSQDYKNFNQIDEFSDWVSENNDWIINGVTGYEQYYSDLDGFWRELYHIDSSINMGLKDKFQDGKTYKIHFCDTRNFINKNAELKNRVLELINNIRDHTADFFTSGNTILTQLLRDIDKLLNNIPDQVHILVSTYEKYLKKLQNYGINYNSKYEIWKILFPDDGESLIHNILQEDTKGLEKNYTYNVSKLKEVKDGKVEILPNKKLYIKQSTDKYIPIGNLYDIIKTNYSILQRQIERLVLADIKRCSEEGLYDMIKEKYPDMATEDVLYFKDPKTVVLNEEGHMVKPSDSKLLYHKFQNIYVRQAKDGKWEPSVMSATRNNRLYTRSGIRELKAIIDQYPYLSVSKRGVNTMMDRLYLELWKTEDTIDGKIPYYKNVSTFCHGVEDTYFEWFIKKANSYYSLGTYYPLNAMELYEYDEDTDKYIKLTTLSSILATNNMHFERIIDYNNIWSNDRKEGNFWTADYKPEASFSDDSDQCDYNQRLFVLKMLLFQFPDLISIIEDGYDKNGWNVNIFQNPESLKFWLDFLDTDGELSKYSISAIGQRAKVINDSQVKAIKYQDTMKNIFMDLTDEVTDSNEKVKEYFKSKDKKTNYVYYNLGTRFANFISVSSQGKDAVSVVADAIYNNAYSIESISLNCVPQLFLQPNSKINIYENETGVNGTYILKKISLSFGHNSTMTLQATKTLENNILRQEINLI